MARLPAALTRLLLGISLAFWFPVAVSAQAPEMLCEHGAGGYSGTSRTGVTVTVEADKSSGLATRSCSATLKSGGTETVVADAAAELDLDMLDATLEDDTVVAGFQVRQSDKDCCVTYRLYSLQDQPRLLFEMHGGSSFIAQDADLNDEIEFWTDDGAVIQGFEGIMLSEFDFLPTYVLRYYSGGLHDASAEFVEFYDKNIHEIKARLNPDAVRDFRASDGLLRRMPKMSVADLDRLRGLRQAKIKILELVWAYLYSGRAQQAESAVKEYWPPSDRQRIWSAILNARQGGISGQLPAVTGPPARIAVFRNPTTITYTADPKSEDSTILARIHHPIEGTFSMDLIIDAAGKVRDVHSRKRLPADIIAAAKTWKFVPAWRSDRSVASFRARTFFLKK